MWQIDNQTSSLPVLGEASEKYLVQWALAMQKQGLPAGRMLVIHQASGIYRYMFGSMRYVGLVGWG